MRFLVHCYCHVLTYVDVDDIGTNTVACVLKSVLTTEAMAESPLESCRIAPPPLPAQKQAKVVLTPAQSEPATIKGEPRSSRVFYTHFTDVF